MRRTAREAKASVIPVYSYIPGYAIYWDMQGRVRASLPKMVVGNKYSLL